MSGKEAPFRPVGWLEGRPGWNDPNRIPSSPFTLPNRADRLRLPAREFNGDVPTNLDPGLNNEPSNLIRDPHHYADLIQFYGSVPDATAPQESVLILPRSNVRRNWLSIRNPSVAATIYLGFGQPAAATSPLVLTPGQTILFDVVVPQNDMWVLASGPDGLIAFAWSTIVG